VLLLLPRSIPFCPAAVAIIVAVTDISRVALLTQTTTARAKSKAALLVPLLLRRAAVAVLFERDDFIGDVLYSIVLLMLMLMLMLLYFVLFVSG
jgi:hypothetical protein